MSDVDIFWGGEGFVLQPFHRSKQVRAEIFWYPANLLKYVRNAFQSSKDVTL